MVGFDKAWAGVIGRAEELAPVGSRWFKVVSNGAWSVVDLRDGGVLIERPLDGSGSSWEGTWSAKAFHSLAGPVAGLIYSVGGYRGELRFEGSVLKGTETGGASVEMRRDN